MKSYVLAALLAAGALVTGCGKDAAQEQENIEAAGEKAGEELGEAAGAVGKAAQEVGEEAGEAVNAAAAEVRDEVNERDGEGKDTIVR